MLIYYIYDVFIKKREDNLYIKQQCEIDLAKCMYY